MLPAVAKRTIMPVAVKSQAPLKVCGKSHPRTLAQAKRPAVMLAFLYGGRAFVL